MKNREKLANMALVDMIWTANGKENPRADGCIIDKLLETEKQKECPEKESCYDCISAWLNEEAEKMYINGKWYTEPEIEAYINKLEAQISQRNKFISSVRSYYSETMSWDELFEEDYQRLAEDINVPARNGGAEG